MKDYKEILKTIDGSGGGKDKSRAPVEAPNSLQSNATIKIVEVISEGEIKGIVGDAKGVFFDDTPVQNLDDTFNFPAIKFEYRKGTDDQEYLPGFPGVEAAVVVNTEIKFATPVIRSVSSSVVDAVRVQVRIPSALQQIDTKTGDQNGYRVRVLIDTRPTGGTWTQVFAKTITGKTTGTYEEAYRIEKPVGITTGWDIRLRRENQESTSNNTSDRVDWFSNTEIQDIKVAYENAAVVGIALDAESTGGNIPKRSYLVDGIICQVPTNYTPTVYNEDGTVDSYASYAGVWDGTFKWSWTDDTSWIIYDMLTNQRYGAGNEIDSATVDRYSFYEMSKYNCELIDNGNGENEPRFRCNLSLATREDSFKMLNAVLWNCRAYLWGGPGYVKVIQDRPQAPRKKINNAQVVNGLFTYTGTELSTRITAVDVTYNNRLDRYLPVTVTEMADEISIAKYGYQKLELAALGVVDETQARRMAKWAWDTTLTATEIVDFKVSWQNATLEQGEVFEVYDNFYINAQVSGMVSTATAGSGYFDLTLDRMLWIAGTATPIPNGTSLSIIKLDGNEVTGILSNVVTHDIDPVGGDGYVTARWTPQIGSPTLIVDEVIGTPFAINGVVEPRQFRVTRISYEDVGVYAITAIIHDPTKYARIEEGIVTDPPIFTVLDGFSIAAPASITAAPETYINPQGLLRYRLRFNWAKVVDPYLNGYKIRWRRENGQFQWSALITQNEYLIEDALPGIYEYSVFAYNNRGIQSPSRDGYFTLETYEGQPSLIAAPTGLELIGGGLSFSGTNFTIKWNAPPTLTTATLMDYQIVVKDGSTVIQTINQTGTTLLFERSQIIAWAGSAIRSITITVSARDTLERLSLPVTATFVNPAPAALTGMSLTAGFTQYWLEHAQLTATDLGGVYVWHSTTSGFTPDNTTLVMDDLAYSTLHMVNALPDTQYYVRAAAYDNWSNQGLNISSEYTITTNSNIVGIVLVAPTGLTATSSITTSETGVEQAAVVVSWNNSANALGYILEITNLTDGTARYPAVGQAATGGVTSYNFTAQPGTQYRFRVKATAATAESPYSSSVTIITAADTTGPTSPTALVVTPAYSAMVVSWTNPGDNDLVSMEIWRRVGSSGTGSLIVTQATSQTVALTTYYDGGLTIGSSYSYRIRGIDRSGNLGTYTAWSAAQTVANVPNFSINGQQIAAGAVNTSQLAINAVTAANILNGSVGSSELAALAVLAGNIANGAVGSAQIATGGIQETNIGNNSISTRTIIANAVVASTIAAGAVVAGKIAANAVVADTIAAGAITAGKIDAGAVTAGTIAAGAVTANSLAANSVTANAIAANSIATNKLQAGSITAGLIAADAITAVHISTGSITADAVSTNQIITNQANIANAVISNAAIQNLAVDSAKIANAAITSAKFAGTIQSDNYSAGTSGWMIRRDTGAAEFGQLTARGSVSTGTGTSTRVELLSNDANFLLWAGTGTRTAANAQFYVDTSGNAVFKGDVTANSISGAYQTNVQLNWGGSFTTSSTTYQPFYTFTHGAPVRAGEYHNPMLVSSIFIQSTSGDNGVIRVAIQKLIGATWTTMQEYHTNQGNGVGFFHSLTFNMPPTNQSEQYRYALKSINNGNRLSIGGITGMMMGIK